MPALTPTSPASGSPGFPRPNSSRASILAAVLDPSRLPTPPGVALQIIEAASKPNCRPAEIVPLLSRDPVLCAKLLRAVNSCLYGLSKPVGSLERAVVILGLNPLRSLALGLSIPATQGMAAADAAMRSYWLNSVSGAILAREVAIRMKHPFPEDDLVAGLLRDLGAIMMQRTYPDAWQAVVEAQRARPGLPARACECEEAVFGITHPEVTAELLHSWQIPDDTVEPIRHHHTPNRLPAGSPLRTARAELLHFAECLTQLDVITQDAAALDQFLALARDRFGLPQLALVSLLESVVPKIDAFAGLLNLNIGACPDFARILGEGSEALVRLTVEASRPSSPTAQTAAIGRCATPPGGIGRNATLRRASVLPEFREEFLHEFPAGGCRLEGYELRQLLGRGTMGVVFKAYEPGLDRYAAVKVLPSEPAADPTALERFAREAKTAAAIRHENVVLIYTVGESQGISYLAMEYVDGGSLQELLEEKGRQPTAVVARVAREAAAGLAAAHARQIIHRDVKPANILLDGASGRVKISDFGLAHVASQKRLSLEGALVGTPLFMAPEQILGRPLDARTDLFALGGVLYALATGELPFPGDNVTDVLMNVCEYAPVAPHALRPDVPEWLDAVIMRLLQKDPAQRFASAAELTAHLRKMQP